MEGSLRENGHSVGLAVEALAILIVAIGLFAISSMACDVGPFGPTG